jgi:hypothetical protein
VCVGHSTTWYGKLGRGPKGATVLIETVNFR